MPSFCADFVCHISFSSSCSMRGPVSSLWDKQRRSVTLSLQLISTQMVQTMRNFTTQLTLNQVIVCYYALDIAVLLPVVYLTKNKPQKLASNCVVGAKQCWGLEYFPPNVSKCAPFSPAHVMYRMHNHFILVLLTSGAYWLRRLREATSSKTLALNQHNLEHELQ